MKRLFLAAILLVAGCAAPTIQTNYDNITNTTFNHTGGVYLARPMGEDFQVVLNFCQKVHGNGHAEYYLVLRSVALVPAEPFARLDPDPSRPSLLVLADGHRYAFGWNDVQGDRYWFPVHKDQARAIAMANDIQIRVIRLDGSNWERTIPPGGCSAFHAFADRFLN